MFIPYRILGVIRAAAKEGTRYAMNGVHFQRMAGKAVATTTDGRRLLMVKWIDSNENENIPGEWLDPSKKREGFAKIIPCDALVSASKLPYRRGGANPQGFYLDETNIDTETAILHLTDRRGLEAQINIRTVVGIFPPLAGVIPSYVILKEDHSKEPERRAVRIAVNPRFLAEMAEKVVEISGSTHGVVLTIPTDPGKPIIMEAQGDCCEALSVVMPMTMPVIAQF